MALRHTGGQHSGISTNRWESLKPNIHWNHLSSRSPGIDLKYLVFPGIHLAAHLLTGLPLEGTFVLELVMNIEETEAEGVWRVVKGHLHVRTLLGDVQVPRLPD